jgi:hypothetical protein
LSGCWYLQLSLLLSACQAASIRTGLYVCLLQCLHASLPWCLSLSLLLYSTFQPAAVACLPLYLPACLKDYCFDCHPTSLLAQQPASIPACKPTGLLCLPVWFMPLCMPVTMPTCLYANQLSLFIVCHPVYYSFYQCGGSGLFIPDPDFYPSRIPDPRTATKERDEKKFVVITFKVATNFTKLHIILVLMCWRKKFGPSFKEL